MIALVETTTNSIPDNNKSVNKKLFDDYENFVDKFKPKRTTDDCYTPLEIYDTVLKYVAERFDLTEKKILRPFFPAGDYEIIDYPKDGVVIDNPPFSIISEIARFYIARGVKFFLFAPHMTLFSADINCTAVVCGADVIYENGAKVKTSFISNMLGDNLRVLGAPCLYNDLQAINERAKVSLPRYIYPQNVLTVSMVQKWVQSGVPVKFSKTEIVHIRQLDSQKTHKKTLFGSGFLLSEKAAMEKVAMEKGNTVVWELSDREREIIKKLK